MDSRPKAKVSGFGGGSGSAGGGARAGVSGAVTTSVGAASRAAGAGGADSGAAAGAAGSGSSPLMLVGRLTPATLVSRSTSLPGSSPRRASWTSSTASSNAPVTREKSKRRSRSVSKFH